MPRKTGTSAKAHRDQLREHMRALGCSVPQIATEMARRVNVRPRPARRRVMGWPQWQVAQRYNILHPDAELAGSRVRRYETWPHGGLPPTPRYLAGLAATYGHGCTPADLVDADDLAYLTPPAAKTTAADLPPPAVTQPGSELAMTADPAGEPSRAARSPTPWSRNW